MALNHSRGRGAGAADRKAAGAVGAAQIPSVQPVAAQTAQHKAVAQPQQGQPYVPAQAGQAQAAAHSRNKKARPTQLSEALPVLDVDEAAGQLGSPVITFDHVTKIYPAQPNKPALSDISLQIYAGEFLFLVGHSGSGKSTFIKLLTREIKPTEGHIYVADEDLTTMRNWRVPYLRRNIGCVFQDFKLLSQPLGKNVAASEDYDRARAEQCLVKAGFGARLEQLPEGLDTFLYRDFDENGVEISGGEAQKIALARVLYQDAPFIVLDEPTAALDPEAEAEVYTKFNDIVEDKTAVYISHRLSSCRFCDEIAVFDGGRVVQQGTHDSLLEAQGKYRSLWQAQAQYYQKRRQAREADME